MREERLILVIPAVDGGRQGSLVEGDFGRGWIEIAAEVRD